MPETRLSGLEGNNPLGFLAAVGVQELFRDSAYPPRLWWTDDAIPCAVTDIAVDLIVEQAIEVLPNWSGHRSLNPRIGIKVDHNAKFAPADIRRYVSVTQDGQPGSSLATALVAEGSLDNNGVAKPSDLYFTAGQQRFLNMAREILSKASPIELREGLMNAWSYTSRLPSLMWDVVDDRVYALAAFDPAGEKKLSNPGPEALAILGLSRHPVFAGKARLPGGMKRDRTLTQGCSGSWKHGHYTWPLWCKPAGRRAVQSILVHATGATEGVLQRRGVWYRSWGVSQVMKSAIRRSAQGGYGTFGPPEIIWP